ncbi:MAG: hypothetical protein O2968_20985 [Acidobacteria bacterium]|nr:hypothetical protein [Acidobacteriota bacterium]
MVIVSSLIYVSLAFLFAARIARYVEPPTCLELPPDGGSRLHLFLVWTVVAWSLFLVPFHFLGFVDLALGYRVVGPGYACLVLGASVIAFLLWEQVTGSRRKPVRFFSPRFAAIKPAPTLGGILLGLFAIGLLFLGFVRITGYPIRLEGLAYHLPIGVHTFQTGSLGIWDPAFMHTYPANQSLYLGFLLGWLPEQLVSAANIPFLALLALALFGLSRAVTQDFDAISLATVGVVTMPIVMQASETIESDISGIALLALSAYFTLAGSGTHRRGCYVLAGLAAGLAFGFKSLHLVGILFLAALVAAREYFGNGGDNEQGLPRAARSFSLFVAASLAASSFWLIRNYIELGNPLYPVFIPHIFPILGWAEPPDASIVGNLATQLAYVDSGWEWLIYPWRERGSVNLGPFFAVAAPLSIVYAAWRLSGRGRANRFTLSAMSAGCLVITAVWWLLGDRQPRYAMGALGFLAPLIAWTLSQLDRQARVFFNYTVVFATLLGFSLSLFSSGLDLVRRTILTDQSARHMFYEYPPEINRLPAGSVIVNLGFDHRDGGNHRTRAWNYPLFGKALTNRVVSFSEAVRLFSANPYETQAAPAYRLTVEGLRTIKATHLFVIGAIDIDLEEGLSLIEQDRLDLSPVTKTLLAEPRVLYQIRYVN